MAFYENYVRLCNKIGKSPSAVAIELGIGKPSVSRWKSGSSPRDATLLKIADYFGVPVSELTEETQDKKNALDPYLDKSKRTEYEEEVLKWFHSLPEGMRREILELAKKIKD